jgi:hypothetical protein
VGPTIGLAPRDRMGKNCSNCQTEWPADYLGQCAQCGAPVGKAQDSLGNATEADKNSQLHQSATGTRRSDSMARTVIQNPGRGGGMQLPSSTVEVAQGFSSVIANDFLEASGEG